MQINPKLKVGDIAQHVINAGSEERTPAMLVMEIQTQTCYAGTQIFYLCRSALIERKVNKWAKEPKEEIEVHFMVPKDSQDTGWKRFREDELRIADQQVIDILTNKQS